MCINRKKKHISFEQHCLSNRKTYADNIYIVLDLVQRTIFFLVQTTSTMSVTIFVQIIAVQYKKSYKYVSSTVYILTILILILLLTMFF